MKKYLFFLFLLLLHLSIFKLNVFTKENFYTVVINMGYDDVVTTPLEVVDFTIPKDFDKVYNRYNVLQKEGGYDLSLYKGKECKRYTYSIPSLNARANIIVHNGNIIGGDISGITIDGIMIPIKRSTTYAT